MTLLETAQDESGFCQGP